MITSTVNGVQRFGEITAEIEKHVIRGLEIAAEEGTVVAEGLAGKYTPFRPGPVRGTIDGYESGVVAENKLLGRVFDKGTLGKRKGNLSPRSRRKSTWQVTRRGATYTAHRGNIEGKGVEGTQWGGKTRSAGRKALLTYLDRL